MALSRFSIIVAIDSGNGIAKNGEIPWNSRSDMKFFRETTYGKGRNAVIMGRITYESIPPQHRPLQGRHCVVVSRTWKQENFNNITVCSSLIEALSTLGSSIKQYDNVFIAGGEQIYGEAVRDLMYLCDGVYVTRFKTDHSCDQFFPWDAVKDYKTFLATQKTRDYIRHFLLPNDGHEEYQYLKLIRDIAQNGESKPDRTGTGTMSRFGTRMEFDISKRFPILTTKKVFYKTILKELLFFISGKTDSKLLEDQGVNIWKGNSSRKYLDSIGLDEYEVGDLGPVYGFQWRHWGAKYKGKDGDYTGKGTDQLTNLIEGIRKNPHSRRHILSAWNVSQLKEMCLPPCHFACQFYVSHDRKYLDCQLYQRSGDLFLGVPFNIACYSALTYMIAHITGLRPRKFIHVIGDAHIYKNHLKQVFKQIKRTPQPFPTLKFRGSTKIHEIDDFDIDSFIVEGYSSWPHIPGKISV